VIVIPAKLELGGMGSCAAAALTTVVPKVINPNWDTKTVRIRKI
jgi:hypothetical protein